jgi:hypothetical protein
MSPSENLTNVIKLVSSTHQAHTKSSHQHQLQPAAIHQWLEETPHDEPWPLFSSTVGKCSTSEAEHVIEELEQNMALDMAVCEMRR